MKHVIKLEHVIKVEHVRLYCDYNPNYYIMSSYFHILLLSTVSLSKACQQVEHAKHPQRPDWHYLLRSAALALVVANSGHTS